jgi:hypothetical protein
MGLMMDWMEVAQQGYHLVTVRWGVISWKCSLGHNHSLRSTVEALLRSMAGALLRSMVEALIPGPAAVGYQAGQVVWAVGR